MFAIAFGEYDNQNLSGASQADGHETPLSSRIEVLNGHSERVVENSLGISKRDPVLLEIRVSLYWVVLERHPASIYTMYAYRKPRALRGLTTELSGRPLAPLRIGEHAIHCEHDAPATIHGPLQ